MYNDSHLFPSSGGWNTKQEQGARRFSVWWSPASGSHMAIFLLCPHVAGMSEGALWVSFMRALISFMRAVLASPDYFLKVPSPNTITSGTRLQHMNFRGHKHSVCSTHQGLDCNTWISGDTNIQSIALMHYQGPSPVKNLVLQHKFETWQQKKGHSTPEPSLGSAEAITGATSKLNFSPSPILILLHFLP